MTAKPDTSDEAALKATGRDWPAWRKLLDEAGASDWSHKQIVAWLAENTDISSWWRQQVTVGYEKMSGKRLLGQTADAGFQVGVRRTFPLPLEQTWDALTSPDAMTLWLGAADAVLAPGAAYGGAGVAGEIRVVKPRDRVRFTRTEGSGAASTVQIALTATGPAKTSLTFHHEKLSSSEERNAIREHWRAVADALAQRWGGA
jgi:uncharacterized protein YndB with AHSA1/START domain